MKTVLVCLLLVAACNCAKLPPSFKKCNRNQNDFNDCLSKAVEDALRQLTKPFKEIGLPSLDPLEIPSLTIGAGTGAVGLQQNYKNVKIYGFTNPISTKFEIDLDKKTAKIESTYDELKMVADYDVNGKILLLPVYGNGISTITMEKMKGWETWKLDEYEKKGKKYLKVVDGKLGMEPGLVKFNFENLFNGNKALGDNINKVLNDNWRDVFNDVKGNYEEAYGQIGTSLFGNVLTRVPLDELFEG